MPVYHATGLSVVATQLELRREGGMYLRGLSCGDWTF